MEQLTIPNSAEKLKVSQEAINQHIRNYKKEHGNNATSFYIKVKKNKYKVKIIDGVPFIIFK